MHAQGHGDHGPREALQSLRPDRSEQSSAGVQALQFVARGSCGVRLRRAGHGVIGPPCVGKTAYVRDHMAPGDIVVDPSRLAVACVDGGSEAHALADTLWGSAYRRVSRMVTARHVWLVRALPTSRNSPNMLAEWIALNYDVVVLDADDQLLRGRMAECRRGREDVELLKRWRRLGITQAKVDGMLETRRTQLSRLRLIDGPSSPPAVSARPRW